MDRFPTRIWSGVSGADPTEQGLKPIFRLAAAPFTPRSQGLIQQNKD